MMDDDALSTDIRAISIWEIALKSALRKERSDDKPISGKEFLREIERALIVPLPAQPLHGAAVDDLPMLHGDPFDRFRLATARHEGMTFLGHDAALAGYGDFVAVI